jgi:hypothetical protein
MTRIFRLPILVVLVITLALTVSLFASTWQPSTAATTVDVGMPQPGQNSMEFVGIVDQDGLNFTYYGYVTYLAGASNSLLFTGPFTQTEDTARFTFHGTATMTERAIISNVFNLNAAGTITFYYDESPGADFDNPASFIRGTAIATSTTRFHNVLSVIAPNTGVATGMAELTQTATEPFEVSGQTYYLGRTGMQQRFTYSGSGVRLEPTTPRAIIIIAADGQVTNLPIYMPNVHR